ncbi:MAG: FAD-binding oxidoreductase [Parvularculaceae bacterium]
MADLLFELKNAVGDIGLITGEDVRQRPGDWRGATQCQAKAIIRPASTREVSQVAEICHRHRQPVIAAGGLTGLVHGVDAGPDEIVLSLERMTAIENIDPVGRTMTVQAGAPLEKVQNAATDAGLHYAVDLGARGSATIGGNISTNAGGNQVLRYGMTREQVLGLEAVLADGTVISSMNRLLKNNSGYDLKQLFIGTEGTLGIVTRAVLKLAPQPHEARTAFLACDDFDAVARNFSTLGTNYGPALTSFEVMWDNYYDLIVAGSDRHQAPVPHGHKFYIIVEANMEDEARFASALETNIEAGLIADAAIAQSGAQRGAMWAIRDDIIGLMTAMLPGAVFDVSLPITEMAGYAEEVTSKVASAWGVGARTVIFGHLGDGNLHIVISAPEWDETMIRQCEEFVYAPLARFGGAISAEHGIGLEKREYLKLSRSADEIALMRRLKLALDPAEILNPGKVFTTHS